MPSKTSVLTFLTHSLSASGAVIALLALNAIDQTNWEQLFFWLGLALIIDGIDGPIARWVDVKSRPRFSGARIDLIVDYLTYVFIPAIAFVKAAFLPLVPSFLLATVMLLSAFYHFSDTKSKDKNHAFIGFPAIWNVVVFYLFVFQPPPLWSAAVIVIFGIMTFLPLRWSHPFRNSHLRALTLTVTLAGSIAAIWLLWTGFAASATLARSTLLLSVLYGLSLVGLNATIWRNPAGRDG